MPDRHDACIHERDAEIEDVGMRVESIVRRIDDLRAFQGDVAAVLAGVLALPGVVPEPGTSSLNLDDEWPPFFATFDRLLEIVTNDEEDRNRARRRYAFYDERGYDINVNTIKG